MSRVFSNAGGRIRNLELWDQIVATVEVWTRNGLRRFVVLFFLELSDKTCVEIGGIAANPNGEWMTHTAPNVTDAVDGFFIGKSYLIHDPDPLYSTEFLIMLAEVAATGSSAC